MVQTIVLPRCSTPKNEWFHVKTRILCAFANDTCDDAVTVYAAMICTARQFREPQYKLTNRMGEVSARNHQTRYLLTGFRNCQVTSSSCLVRLREPEI